MKMRLVPVPCVLFVLWVLSIPGASADPAEDAVRQCFATYKSALLSKDGLKAAAAISANSLDYYDRMRKLALTGSRQEVEGLPDVDKVMVLALRVRAPRPLLETGSPAEMVKFAVDSGMIGEASVKQLDLGKITIKDKEAEGEIVSRGTPVGASFRFHREGESWKLDIEQATILARGTFAAIAKESGMTENELILKTLSVLAGKEIGEEIWKPLVQR